jgi:V/A-type H+-transporting ATPase subunit K
MKQEASKDKRALPLSAGSIALTIAAAVCGAIATAMVLWSGAAVSADAPAAASKLPGDAWGWGLLAAALATGLSSLGAGYAVAKVGTAAVGALAEKPELLGRLLIFVGLAEGIAIYGLIVSILILDRLV